MIRKNIFSVLVALAITYLSLAGSDNFDKVPFYWFPGIDKVVHIIMYFTLMSVIVLEHKITGAGVRRLLLVSLIPFLFGIIMELCQQFFTTTRSGSILDAAANYSGILLALLAIIFYDRKIRSRVKK